jgi:prolyl-tRNA synthetase
MLLSHLFTRTSKEAVADASSKNAELLTRAGYIHKTMAGVYSYLPLGLRVLRNIEQIVREEMDGVGGQEILMSALAPKENWDQTGRWDTVDVLYKIKGADEHEYALNPTHEEVITPLAKTFVKSYRDLPFAAYQIQTKFRNELRAKSGVLRGREFLMKDLYSFHVDQADLDRYYDIVQGAYDRVFERLGLAQQTYLTYASGGTFSQYSHEYQVVLDSGEDSIYISEEAEKKGMRIAVNKEIYEAGKTVCPVTGGTTFREAKASEAGNIFKLGTKFSAPFGLQFTDAGGKRLDIVMGCYGIGISRLMGIVTEAMCDDKGLVWPENIAPAQVHIVPIAKSADDDAFKQAIDLKRALEKKGKQVIVDDRLDASVGFKLADADLIGCPVRVVISPKTLEKQSAEVTQRVSGNTVMSPLKDVLQTL